MAKAAMVRPAGLKMKPGAQRAPMRVSQDEQQQPGEHDETEAPEAPAGASSDSPLLDLTDAAVKKMIKAAKARGYVTYDELNSVLPSEQVSSEQIEDTMAMLAEMGINVVETEEEAEEAPAEAAEAPEAGSANEGRARDRCRPTAPTIRCACTLREMGSVELLSREGEIAIAKRIEAGREAMIQGLCESPLTFQAIIIWRDELNEGKILLRDIIDLEATYAGPDAKNAPVQPVGRGSRRKRQKPAEKVEPRRPESPRERRMALMQQAGRATTNIATCCRRRTSTPRASRRSPTRTTRRTTSRSRRWRRSSSPRCSRPSTASPRPTSRCASCRTRKWATRRRCRPPRSAATRSCAMRSSPT